MTKAKQLIDLIDEASNPQDDEEVGSYVPKKPLKKDDFEKDFIEVPFFVISWCRILY